MPRSSGRTRAPRPRRRRSRRTRTPPRAAAVGPPSRRRGRRAPAPTRAPPGTARRAGSRRRRSRPRARASSGRSPRCRRGCPARAPNRRCASCSSNAGSSIVTSSPDHSARIAPIAARTEASRAGRSPSARRGRSPAPIPRIMRPSEISSTVAAAAAVIAGMASERVRDGGPEQQPRRRHRGQREVGVGVASVQRRVGQPEVRVAEGIDPLDHRPELSGWIRPLEHDAGSQGHADSSSNRSTVRASARTPSSIGARLDPLLRRVLAGSSRHAHRDRGDPAGVGRVRIGARRGGTTEDVPTSLSASSAARTSGCAGSTRPAGRSPSCSWSTARGGSTCAEERRRPRARAPRAHRGRRREGRARTTPRAPAC